MGKLKAATALKLVWQSQKFQLAFKAALFGLTAFYSPWAGMIVALWLYFRPPPYQSLSFLSLFLVFLALTAVVFAGAAGLVRWAAVFVFAFLLYLILGLKSLVLIERRYWRLILSFFLLYLVFLNFFLIDQSSWFIGKWLGFLLLVFILVRDLLGILLPLSAPSKTVGWLLTLLFGELLWIASWLPVGFLSLANLTLLFVLLLFDLIAGHFNKTLPKKMVIRDFGLFFALLSVILLTSKWGM